MKRCSFVPENDTLYQQYHDEEWGKPVYNDQKLFEFLLLESFQAGLSWRTILQKRSAFQQAFDNFSYSKIAAYDNRKIEELLQNSDIIRSRSKITAAIGNAQIFMQIQKEYGTFAEYIWHFTDKKIMRYAVFPPPTHNDLSDKISQDLRNRGMKYVGSVIIYSYLQAIGIINDHEQDCCCAP